jgi:hypothetical protein
MRFADETLCAICCYMDKAQIGMIDGNQIAATIDKLVVSMRGVIRRPPRSALRPQPLER